MDSNAVRVDINIINYNIVWINRLNLQITKCRRGGDRSARENIFHVSLSHTTLLPLYLYDY